VLADPYPSYEALRAEGQVVRSDVLNGWVVLGHDEVSAVLRSRDVSAAWIGDRRPYPPRIAARLTGANDWLGRMMLFTDPPDHARMRAITTKAFTPRLVDDLVPTIDRLAHDLIDAVADRGEMDLVSDFAFPFPVGVIGHLLGVPAEDHGRIRAWTEQISRFIVNALLLPAEEALAVSPAIAELSDYLADLVAQRRNRPRADLISAMIQAEEDGRFLDTEELVINFALLLLAGHETTTNMIGLAMHTLFAHPGALDRITADPRLIPAAVEELMRYDSSVQFLARTATTDLPVGGATVGAGEVIFLCLGAANRDPRRYPEPDRFDIDRDGERHGVFGGGIHYCIGAALTRAEMRVGLRALLRRLPHLRPAAEERRWRALLAHRGLQALPIRWDPPPAA